MGVKGLWKVLEPTARPVSFEALRGKKLAVDASIWIYHFVKAMRDPAGVLLRAAHIVGFFRRLCKLLFYEIKPVFIFDGAAPTVKKLTTARRQHRREEREFNAKATANKLLTLQIQRAAKLSAESQSQKSPPAHKVIGSIPKDTQYLGQINGETKQAFVPKDQYHLPDIESMVPVGINDHRLLTQQELDEYASQFTFQARRGILLSNDIDFDSPDFKLLPNESQYQLLNMARMKSRLRMGYTAEELKKLFPDVLEFSRFQIQRVAQRNYFAQRLITMSDDQDDSIRRVSSEKNREYMLTQTGGGWTLSLGGQEKDQKPVIFKDHKVSAAIPIKNHAEDASITKKDNRTDIKSEPLPFGQIQASLGEAITVLSDDDDNDDDDFEEIPLDAKPTFTRPTSAPKSQHGKIKEQKSSLFEDFNEGSDPEPEESALAGVEQPPWFRSKEVSQSTAPVIDMKESEIDAFAEYHDVKSRPGIGFYLQHAKKRDYQPLPVAKKPKLDSTSATAISYVANDRVNPGTLFQLSHTTSEKNNEIPQDFSPLGKNRSTEDLRFSSESSVSDANSSARDSLNTGGQSSLFSAPEPESNIQGGSSSQTCLHSTSVQSATPPNSRGCFDEESSIFGELSSRADSPGLSPILGPVDNHNSHKSTATSSALREPYTDPGPPAIEPSAAAKSTPRKDNVASPTAAEVSGLSGNELELAETEARDVQDEEDELTALMIEEVDEHVRFTKTLQENARRFFNEEQFNKERDRLRRQHAKETRDAEGVTDEMVRDCQDLLQLFGIPYITAPTEAEAQCAVLQDQGLVDGVVTDDGDCFLFGNVTVYRNMFNQAKFVESYNSKIIKSELGLDQQKLISLALLLGSDYTDGILGIGPVLGAEILAEFGDLHAFKSWWEIAQRSVEKESTTPLRKRLLKQHASKIFLKPEFPDQVVIDAYLHPVVELDDSPFSWVPLDTKELCKFMELHAGWDPATTRQLIEPIIQESKRRDLVRKSGQTQASLDDYFNSTRKLNLGSKRASAAAKKLVSRKKS